MYVEYEPHGRFRFGAELAIMSIHSGLQLNKHRKRKHSKGR